MDDKKHLILENMNIRYHKDPESGEFYYSIVDVIENLNLSSDPRNYWKVLKSRLKKGYNELVTSCNQLKMKSSDGKFYNTDVADGNTLLKIIQIIAPKKVSSFAKIFDQVEDENEESDHPDNNEKNEISTVSIPEGEIQIDMYQKDNHIFVRAMLAGIEPQDIFISTNSNELIIKCNRFKKNNCENNREENISDFLPFGEKKSQGEYFSRERFSENSGNREGKEIHELFWGKFSRIISLPNEIDIDEVEATSYHGLLEIKLSILDKTRTKIVKAKSL